MSEIGRHPVANVGTLSSDAAASAAQTDPTTARKASGADKIVFF